MNGLEKITEKILSDARAEADAILRKAAEEVEAVVRREIADGEKEKYTLLQQAARQAQDIRRHGADMAALEGRKLKLQAKQEVLDAVFAQAFAQLKEMPEGELTAFLARLAADAARTGEETVLFASQDQAMGAKTVAAANALLTARGKKAGLTLSADTRETGGGLVLKAGEVETNCTFGVLAQMAREELAGELAALLFA